MRRVCGRLAPALLFAPILAAQPAAVPAPPAYPWLKAYDAKESIAARFAPPAGFERTPVAAGSFEEWLRDLPLKKGRPPVLLFDGSPKNRQDVHAAVIDIDTGTKDLQQCADAVIRLRAEHLYSVRNLSAIHFDFTSGDTADFTKWAQGFRPVVSGNRVSWEKSARPDDSYDSFRTYLNKVFAYAGTASLSRELKKVEDVKDMRIGDVFIQGGHPGHAEIVVDMAADPRTGRKAFLLAQSYMPAQDIHILKNPAAGAPDPWYGLDFGDELKTPEWTFNRENLRRFAGPDEGRR